MLTAHKEPNGDTCKFMGESGKNCLHCGTMVESAVPLPVRANAEKEDEPEPGEPDWSVVKVSDDIDANKTATRDKVLELVREHLTLDDLVTELLDYRDCQEGSITLGPTRKLLILPDKQ